MISAKITFFDIVYLILKNAVKITTPKEKSKKSKKCKKMVIRKQ